MIHTKRYDNYICIEEIDTNKGIIKVWSIWTFVLPKHVIFWNIKLLEDQIINNLDKFIWIPQDKFKKDWIIWNISDYIDSSKFTLHIWNYDNKIYIHDKLNWDILDFNNWNVIKIIDWIPLWYNYWLHTKIWFIFVKNNLFYLIPFDYKKGQLISEIDDKNYMITVFHPDWYLCYNRWWFSYSINWNKEQDIGYKLNNLLIDANWDIYTTIWDNIINASKWEIVCKISLFSKKIKYYYFSPIAYGKGNYMIAYIDWKNEEIYTNDKWYSEWSWPSKDIIWYTNYWFAYKDSNNDLIWKNYDPTMLNF